PSSSDQFLDDLSRVVTERIGDFYRAPDRAWVLLTPINTHRFVYRGVQISDRDQAFGHLAAAFVAGADDLSPAQAASRNQHRPAVGPVIATGFRVHQRRPTELAHHEDDRGFQQAALI